MQKKTSSKPSNKKPSKWEKNKVGVFWTKEQPNGKTFLSGNINIDGKLHKVCIFKNDFMLILFVGGVCKKEKSFNRNWTCCFYNLIVYIHFI